MFWHTLLISVYFNDNDFYLAKLIEKNILLTILVFDI